MMFNNIGLNGISLPLPIEPGDYVKISPTLIDGKLVDICFWLCVGKVIGTGFKQKICSQYVNGRNGAKMEITYKFPNETYHFLEQDGKIIKIPDCGLRYEWFVDPSHKFEVFKQ